MESDDEPADVWAARLVAFIEGAEMHWFSTNYREFVKARAFARILWIIEVY